MMGGRLQQFLRRHGRDTPRMAAMALARTMYQREAVRRCVRPLVRPRVPSKWIFLVGCYNSGTTFAQSLLAAHPDIATLPWEGSLITSVLPNPEDCGWTRMWLHCRDHMKMPHGYRPDLAERIVRDWSPWWNKRTSVFLDKSITNVTRMAWLDQHFPNAYFLGIVRNGYCVAEGICRKTALRPRRARQWGGTYPIEMAGQQWVTANECLLEGAQQVTRYHQLTYESLLEDPIGVLAKVWHFLEMPLPAMELGNPTLHIAGVPKTICTETNDASLARLSASEQDRLREVIGSMLERLGYEHVRPQAAS